AGTGPRAASDPPLARREPERRPFGVAADGPPRAGVHDRAAELDDTLERARQIVDREVRQRPAVARPRAALVQAEPGRSGSARLQPAPLAPAAFLERDLEQLLPEAARALEVVG